MRYLFMLALLNINGDATTANRGKLLGLMSSPDATVTANLKRFIETCDALGKDCTGKLNAIPGLQIEGGDTQGYNGDESIGVCLIWTLGIKIAGSDTLYRKIVLSPITKSYTADMQYLLVAHEASHCLLNQDHNTSKKTHLMNQYINSQEQIDAYPGGADQIVMDSILDINIPKIQD